jgi:hypothetical protein
LADIFSYDSVAALRLAGCPLCRTLAKDDRRWMQSFWREGRQDSGARQAFYDAGGFCKNHAWLLHAICSEEGTGAAIADLYGRFAERDLAGLRRPRKRQARNLFRRSRCPACRARDEAAERKAHFFVGALGEPGVRNAYTASAGLCFTHLALAVEQAWKAGDAATAEVLLEDWGRRLEELRVDLAEYDRKRDYRYASEPTGREQRAWTEAIRRYAGEKRR